MWDPNDLTNETVFAGGISGGIFKNTSISLMIYNLQNYIFKI